MVKTLQPLLFLFNSIQYPNSTRPKKRKEFYIPVKFYVVFHNILLLSDREITDDIKLIFSLSRKQNSFANYVERCFQA